MVKLVSDTILDTHIRTVDLDVSTAVPACCNPRALALPVLVAEPRQVAADEQPRPTLRPDLPDMWEIVQQDMRARADAGFQRYGSSLRPFNGRVPLIDAYQECLDLAVYLRQKIWEDENEPARP